MKRILMSLVILSFGLTINSQSVTSKDDSISYAVGVLFAKNLKQQGVESLNEAVVAKAISDYLSGEVTVLNDTQCEVMMNKYLTTIREERANKAKKAGLDFLAMNSNKEGVVTLPSGLQYEILVAGDGPKPSATDKVKTHYHGTLIDGTVFDSSVERGEPISFPVNGVIKGWQEALQLMPVGSKWKLYVPSDLAYGSRPAGKIPPHSTLIFEVELLDIE